MAGSQHLHPGDTLRGANTERPDERHRDDDARTFRLVQHDEEFLVMSAPVTSAAAASLTRAQLEVARAVVQGASNAEIACIRGTAVRTVANQVASILRRLGASSRAQVAAKLALADVDPAEGSMMPLGKWGEPKVARKRGRPSRAPHRDDYRDEEA
jgi:DNA-binding CsgD family transcriptional regulator